ncbi:MAG: pentapeptide repeat-containing protein [Lyngbya sp. HA4199-MV5]|jgi:uncharacterized protein YjbI with pentapeptide repeats|nr:pentapeptide repeat-containing protein [Lyngbya sp. HA4199-MV5]
MKATEVLNRYANGERDFRRANLRGQSFKGQDLSGADFTEADICGANFTNAVLKGVNFIGATTGIQKQWLASQLLLTFVLVVLTGILQGILAYFFFNFSPSSWWNTINITTSFANRAADSIAFFIGIAATSFAIMGQGFTTKTAATISLAISIAAAVSIAGAFTGVGSAVGPYDNITIEGTYSPGGGTNAAIGIIVSGLAAGLSVFAGAGSIAVAVTASIATAIVAAVAAGIAGIAGVIGVAGVGTCATAIAVSTVSTDVSAVANVASVGSGAMLNSYVAWRTFKGDEKFSLTRSFGIALAAIGGTTFCGADLTGANFTKALLKSSNFTNTWKKDDRGKRQESETILELVCWHDAKKLERARVGKSILADPAVRDLLVTRNGYKKSYVDAKLRNADLNGVNLEGADLTWADLSCSHLQHAKLKDAKLLEAMALDTDFTGATLTGACLEAWNIDSNTRLEGVDCQYVYLLRDQQERRPSSGDFAPGEFTKLFQEVLNTVDLIFRNGVDWKAFVSAFKTVQVNNDGTELTIQSIENKGDGVVVVRVSVPEAADKAKIHSEFNQNYDRALKALEAKYHAELKAKDEQITIYREKSADMTEILRLLANRPVTVEVNASAESKAMSDSTDKSQSVNIGGNVTGSTINLGEISGSVSNVVNQLSSAPDPAQPGIKELLIELQAAIESDADLPEKGKASALEQVKVLAEVAQDPEQPEKKGLGSQAITFFKNAASFLPDTAKLAEACTKLLPLITKALGLPF